MMAAADLKHVKIIDADGHVRDNDADLRKFMAEPYCRRQGGLLPNDPWDSSMYGKLGMRVHDVPTRLRDMDTEGIDISVLFPTRSFAVTMLPEKDYAAAFCRAYNEWVASICAESPRLKAVALVPFQDVDAAVQEIERAIIRLGLAGIAVLLRKFVELLGPDDLRRKVHEIEAAEVEHLDDVVPPGVHGEQHPARVLPGCTGSRRATALVHLSGHCGPSCTARRMSSWGAVSL